MKDDSARKNLEVKIEYDGASGFRKSLFNIIRKLAKNEYLRFVVTRRGKPAAVLMSYDAYNLLLRLAQRVADEDEHKSRDQRLKESSDRMTAQYGPPAVFTDAEMAKTSPSSDTLDAAHVSKSAEARAAFSDIFKDVLNQEIVYKSIVDQVVERIQADAKASQAIVAAQRESALEK